MAGIPYQSVSFVFGAAEQDTGQRHVKAGGLALAQNVRQQKRSQYRKRRGYARVAPSFTGASWTNPTDTVGLVPGPNGSMFTIDGNGRAWCYDPDAVTWRDRGQLTRVFPQHTPLIDAAGLSKPTIVSVGNNIWVFAIASSKYYYSIIDATTGVMILARTEVAATNIVNLSAAYDGTSVWVIWVAGSTTATAHKFSTSSPASAPTSTTYQTIAGAGLRGVDMRRLTGPSETAVVVSGINGAGTQSDVSRSYLDPATGTPKGSPAAVTVTTVLGANDIDVTCCPSILVSDGTTNWYFAIWEDTTGSINSYGLNLYTVTTATLAASSVELQNVGDTGNTSAIGACCGYLADNGDRVVFAQRDNLTGTVSPWDYTITRYTRSGSTTTATFARGAWIASKPVKIGTSWYLMTGFEDDGDAIATSVQTRGVQRTFNLRDSDGNILGQSLSGAASGLWHRSSRPTTALLASQDSAQIPDAFAVGNVIMCAGLMMTGTLLDLDAGIIAWDTAATYGLPTECQNRAVVPGGVPYVFGHQENIREIAPLVYPNYLTTSGAATVYDCAVVYRFTSPDGTFWRSSPLRGSLSISNGATLTIPTLRTKLANTTCVIEFYAGSSGVPYLQQTKDNDPTVDSITMTFSSTLKTDEALYSVGGALTNAPAPACKHVAVWQGRLFLGGTPEPDVVWSSQEFAPSTGVQLNEVLRSSWLQGTGDITAMAPSGLYLCLFRRDAIAIMNGPGPDGRGSGNFVPQTLDAKYGLTNWRSPLHTSQGLRFQSVDGLEYIVSGSQVVDAYAGMQDYAATDIVCALLDEDEGVSCLFQSDGVILACDHMHPTPEQPTGVFYKWTSSKLIRAYGACVDSSGTPWHMEVTGVLRKPQDALWTDADSGGTTPVLKKLQTGKLAAVGNLGAFRVKSATFLGQYVGSCDFRMTVASGSNTSNHDKAGISSADPLKFTAYPPSLNRVLEVQVTIEETANSGNTEGFVFDALAFEVQPLGGILFPEASERI